MTLRKKFLILALLLAWFGRDGVRAQTGIDLRGNTCGETINGPRFLAIVPAVIPIGGFPSPVNVPICMTLDQLKGYLGVTAAAKTPRQVLERSPLAANIADTQTVFNYTLLKRPAPDSVIFVFLESSQAAQDKARAISPVKGSDGQPSQQISITLPTYRPFVPAQDILTFVYMTLDPP